MSDPGFAFGSPAGSVDEHRAAAPESVRCAVLTVSDTRTPESDHSGAYIRETLGFAGHQVVDYRIVPDEPDQIREVLDGWVGGGNIAGHPFQWRHGHRRSRYHLRRHLGLLEKRIDGFGELFRMLSWQEIGAAAMLSRAVAGVAGGTLIVAMPGSTKAVRLALTKLIVPELGHLIFEINK